MDSRDNIRKQTNFKQLTATVQVLAENVVYVVIDKYSDGLEWMSVLVNGSWPTRQAAVDATIEYLMQDSEQEGK